MEEEKRNHAGSSGLFHSHFPVFRKQLTKSWVLLLPLGEGHVNHWAKDHWLGINFQEVEPWTAQEVAVCVRRSQSGSAHTPVSCSPTIKPVPRRATHCEGEGGVKVATSLGCPDWQQLLFPRFPEGHILLIIYSLLAGIQRTGPQKNNKMNLITICWKLIWVELENPVLALPG